MTTPVATTETAGATGPTAGDSVTVFVSVTPRPGQDDAVRSLLLTLVAPSRQEPGCLGYDLYVGRDGDATIVLVEAWATPAHFEAHLAQPAVRRTFDVDLVDLIDGQPVAHSTSALDVSHPA